MCTVCVSAFFLHVRSVFVIGSNNRVQRGEGWYLWENCWEQNWIEPMKETLEQILNAGSAFLTHQKTKTKAKCPKTKIHWFLVHVFFLFPPSFHNFWTLWPNILLAYNLGFHRLTSVSAFVWLADGDLRGKKCISFCKSNHFCLTLMYLLSDCAWLDH